MIVGIRDDDDDMMTAQFYLRIAYWNLPRMCVAADKIQNASDSGEDHHMSKLAKLAHR
jgi:hypothetical protein